MALPSGPPTWRDLAAIDSGDQRTAAESRAIVCKNQARRYLLLHRSLGLMTTALAALAALSVPADALGESFTGATAAAAALVSGLQQLFRPERQARKVDEESIDWRELASGYQTLVELDFDNLGDDEIRSRLKVLESRRLELERHRTQSEESFDDRLGEPDCR